MTAPSIYAPHSAPCRQCALLARSDQLPAQCGDCGARIYRALSSAQPWRPRRGVDGMLLDLAQLRLAALALPGARSGMGALLDGVRDGVLGHGNSGTKGAGAPETPDPDPMPPPHPAEAHYARLRPLPGHATRALIVRGAVQHATTAMTLPVGRTTWPLTIEQAVGWHALARAEQTRTQVKLASGDRRPALAQLDARGAAALAAAAAEWAS